MKRPSLGQPNLAALIGGIVGSIGGLFGVGVVPALIEGAPGQLVKYPTIGFICFLICGPVGWLVGGQLGIRLERKHQHVKAHWIAGGVAGLVPFLVIVLWGWYMHSS